jgi:hypothetical protein
MGTLGETRGTQRELFRTANAPRSAAAWLKTAWTPDSLSFPAPATPSIVLP